MAAVNKGALIHQGTWPSRHGVCLEGDARWKEKSWLAYYCVETATLGRGFLGCRRKSPRMHDRSATRQFEQGVSLLHRICTDGSVLVDDSHVLDLLLILELALAGSKTETGSPCVHDMDHTADEKERCQHFYFFKGRERWWGAGVEGGSSRRECWTAHPTRVPRKVLRCDACRLYANLQLSASSRWCRWLPCRVRSWG